MGNVLTAYTSKLQNGATGITNGTVMNTGGFAAVLAQLEGWGTATVTFQGLVNDSGGNFTNLLALNLATGAWGTTASANGLYMIPTSGVSQVQAAITAYTSGTLTVTGEGVGVGSVPAIGSLNGMTKVNGFNALLGAPHNSDKATYVASFNVSPTASTDLLAIESPASGIVRVRRIVITNPGNQTSAGLRSLTLIRTTVAGVGSTVTPAPVDSTDSAYGGIVRSGNTGGNLGTAGTTLYTIPLYVPGALATATPFVIDFAGNGTQAHKCPVGIAGTANGLSLRDPGATGGANICGFVEFTVETA